MLQACLNCKRRRHEMPGVPETPEDTATLPDWSAARSNSAIILYAQRMLVAQ